MHRLLRACQLLLALIAANATAQQVETLDNGLRLIVKENHTAPVAALRIYVKTGSIYEQEYLGSGISHVFEHLIHGGTTTTRTEKEIGELLDRLGGATNAYTTQGHTAYYITTDAAKIGDAIDLMADWMKNCTFPQNEVDRELGVVMEELRKGKEEPRRVLSQALYETMFRVHPARYPVIGYEEQVAAITRDDIVAYYQRMYVPNNLIVACVGDFDATEVMARLKTAFEPMKRRALPQIVLPEEPRQLGRRERIIHQEGLGGAYLNLAFHTIPLDHPDLYALDVLSYIVSRGPSSRLPRLLREEQRLVANIYTASYTPEYGAGMFVVNAIAPDANYQQVVDTTLAELYRLRDELVSEQELATAIQQKIADDILGKQTAEDLAASYGTNLLSTGNADFDTFYLEGIRAVTAEDVRRVARTWFRDDNLTVVALRPPPTETATAVAAATVRDYPVQRVELANGLRLLVKRNPGVPLVNIQAVFLGGVRQEPDGKAGLSQLTASLMVRGTTNRTREQIDSAFDRIGGQLSPSSGNNTFGLGATILKEDLGTALEIVGDILRHASFPETEFATVQQNTLRAIARMDDDWQSQLSRLLRESYFTEHPYRYLSVGTAESVAALTAADAKAFYEGYAVPARGVITVFGDIDEATAITLVKQALGDWQRAGAELRIPDPQTPPVADRVVTHLANRQIAAVYAAYPGIALSQREDYYPAQVMDAVLSGIGYPGGRLHEALRGGDNDLVYLVHGINFMGLEPGFYGIQAASSPDKMPRVVAVIEREVDGLRRGLVGAAELEKAKTICITMERLSRQTNGDMALQAALDELYGLGYDHSTRYEAGIQAVTAEDVQRIARRIFTHSVTVRTGPEEPAR